MNDTAEPSRGAEGKTDAPKPTKPARRRTRASSTLTPPIGVVRPQGRSALSDVDESIVRRHTTRYGRYWGCDACGQLKDTESQVRAHFIDEHLVTVRLLEAAEKIARAEASR